MQAASPAHTRIGLIIPSSNRLTEAHMQRYAPEGVQAHVTRLRMTGASHVPLSDLLPRIVEATRALDDARCDAIVFHCTASSMEAGLGQWPKRSSLRTSGRPRSEATVWPEVRPTSSFAAVSQSAELLDGERQVLAAMRSATQAATATTATAALAALNALEMRRIALLSPYVAATHQHEVDFLSQAGIEVVGGKCLGLRGGDEYITVTPAQWLRLAMTNTPRDADGVFLSCTNIHAPEVVQELERTLAKPVVTSTQAVLWYVLRALEQDSDVPRLGRLFRLPCLAPEVVGRTA